MVRPSLRAPVIMTAASVLLFVSGTYFLVSHLVASPIRSSSQRPSLTVGPSVNEFDSLFEKPRLETVLKGIELGTQSFIDEYVKPSYDAVSNGGFVDYTDAAGEVVRYGPSAFVACQLYLLTHFVMYSHDFDIPDDDPFLSKVRHWMVEQFDEEEGRWIWSEEGCLHAKGMIALARMGRRDLVDKAWHWAKESPLWRNDHSMFSIMNSGRVIQTVGPAELSLTGRFLWEYGAPVPDAENSAKFLYAMLLAGHSLEEPMIAELYGGIRNHFSNSPLVFGEVNVGHVGGLVWYIFAHCDFDLPEPDGYDYIVKTIEEGIESGGVLRSFELSRRFIGIRALVVKAAIALGIRSAGVDREVRLFLRSQSPSGAWLARKGAWNQDRPAHTGIRMGQMNGANTYLATLVLIHFRKAGLAG